MAPAIGLPNKLLFALVAALARKLGISAGWFKGSVVAVRVRALNAGIHVRFNASVSTDLRLALSLQLSPAPSRRGRRGKGAMGEACAPSKGERGSVKRRPAEAKAR
jgi:hypothetical protein